MTEDNGKRVYRIPKPVKTEWTLYGLNKRAWAVEAIAVVIGVGQLFAFLMFNHKPGINGSAVRLCIAVFLIGLPFLVLKDNELVHYYERWRYHRKHAALLRWESDRYAFFKDVIQNEEQ